MCSVIVLLHGTHACLIMSAAAVVEDRKEIILSVKKEQYTDVFQFGTLVFETLQVTH